MAYNSCLYLCGFLVIVWLLWAVVPLHAKPFVLLSGSLLFYWASSGRYIVWMLACAGVIWLVGLVLTRLDQIFAQTRDSLERPQRKQLKAQVQALKKIVVGVGAGLVLAAFLWMKYLPFVVEKFNRILVLLPGRPVLAAPYSVLTLGLSFYSLMAVSYVVDVYRGTTAAAPHYWQVVSYLCFWPHVVEGPFDRFGTLSPTLLTGQQADYCALCLGAQRILWGLNKKMVIADRANMYVNRVFGGYSGYSGLAVVCGTLVYTLQIYAEFSGCMDIVIGSAEMFGIPLAENFRQPFFSKSVSEFWRRWHLTLGAWLREYLFQPFIVSAPIVRFGKWCREKIGPSAGRNWPVRLGLFITWVAIGAWHDVGWKYILYGLYYCALQLLGELLEPFFLRVLPQLPQWRKTKWYAGWQIFRTFCLVNVGMLLFRAPGGGAAVAMLRSLVVPYSGSLDMGLSGKDLILLAFGAGLMVIVDLLHERGVSLRAVLSRKPLVLRWAVYVAGFLSVIVLGAYGDNYDPAAFIYAQF